MKVEDFITRQRPDWERIAMLLKRIRLEDNVQALHKQLAQTEADYRGRDFRLSCTTWNRVHSRPCSTMGVSENKRKVIDDD